MYSVITRFVGGDWLTYLEDREVQHAYRNVQIFNLSPLDPSREEERVAPAFRDPVAVCSTSYHEAIGMLLNVSTISTRQFYPREIGATVC